MDADIFHRNLNPGNFSDKLQKRHIFNHIILEATILSMYCLILIRFVRYLYMFFSGLAIVVCVFCVYIFGANLGKSVLVMCGGYSHDHNAWMLC